MTTQQAVGTWYGAGFTVWSLLISGCPSSLRWTTLRGRGGFTIQLQEAQSRTLGGLWPSTAAIFPREDPRERTKFGKLGGTREKLENLGLPPFGLPRLKAKTLWNCEILENIQQFYNSRILQF